MAWVFTWNPCASARCSIVRNFAGSTVRRPFVPGSSAYGASSSAPREPRAPSATTLIERIVSWPSPRPISGLSSGWARNSVGAAQHQVGAHGQRARGQQLLVEGDAGEVHARVVDGGQAAFRARAQALRDPALPHLVGGGRDPLPTPGPSRRRPARRKAAPRRRGGCGRRAGRGSKPRLPPAPARGVFTHAAWPSTRRRNAGRPPVTASRAAAVGKRFSGQSFWSQPRPRTQSAAGSAAAPVRTRATASSREAAPTRSMISSASPMPST